METNIGDGLMAGIKSLSELFEKDNNVDYEKIRISKGIKARVEYVICQKCNQKFQPFYFSGTNEFGFINDKIDECPNCGSMVSFANPKLKNSKEQKIQIFEYLYPKELEEFGIILYRDRGIDIDSIIE